MKAMVAVIVFAVGLSAGLASCHKEERACCAKIDPPYQLSDDNSSAS